MRERFLSSRRRVAIMASRTASSMSGTVEAAHLG
jgi:hypothetical protein